MMLRSGDNMAQGLYQHVRATWKRPKDSLPHMFRQTRMAQWRREPVNCKIDRPTRLDAARRMGYKAKQGVVLVRTRVRRGGLRKGKIHMKRKPSKAGISKITMAKNTQRIAEERVGRHFPNLEVLNSYWVGQDGKHKYFEVIMIDTHHPAIINDKQLGVFCGANGNKSHRGRAYRGKTSAGKRGRGLHNKGKGAEKLRPSLKANQNRGK
jgi:large subunit ribosomal protein L15e|tara:strand:+ start:192 stop:818 length:627 start_codon:yes stop_codon:yes gene_type:complete